MNISTIFSIYLSHLEIYQRFFQFIYHILKYINDSTKGIHLITKRKHHYTSVFPFSLYQLYIRSESFFLICFTS
ncbi:hypothetical protein CBR58_10620 [Bacillus thuringiensis]|nr:hypothetical protein BK736_07865 [Bacillus thuringiensis serovar poloniensis]OTZ36991.1 hypothetical protein BK763_11435 [Bacillus thuringiensis serovar thompsoni]PNK48320.1 hypothetical protein CBR58_10620 [Bacillus thuringiensis]RNG54596.1 hypothetical protein EEL55_08905 [Bacillus thuringiensis]